MLKNTLNTRPNDRSDEPVISSRLLRSSCVFMTLPSDLARRWKAEEATELLRRTDCLRWAGGSEDCCDPDTEHCVFGIDSHRSTASHACLRFTSNSLADLLSAEFRRTVRLWPSLRV